MPCLRGSELIIPLLLRHQSIPFLVDSTLFRGSSYRFCAAALLHTADLGHFNSLRCFALAYRCSSSAYRFLALPYIAISFQHHTIPPLILAILCSSFAIKFSSSPYLCQTALSHCCPQLIFTLPYLGISLLLHFYAAALLLTSIPFRRVSSPGEAIPLPL